ncbi:DUF4112 domain-containing protein [Novosphingobium sp.]|uniref:DUF4112 domain-containing protein n=1 Tax=Novosphingobium sp. TaxID=1874826 RepID=UPI003B52C61F
MDNIHERPINAHDIAGLLKSTVSSRGDAAARMDMVARLLDSAFVVPGTKRTVGIDAVIGLIPGIGDIVTTLLSSYIIWEAHNLGLPRRKIARMVANLAVHATVGSIPFFGDAFDAVFKVNQRNMKIVHRHLARMRS